MPSAFGGDQLRSARPSRSGAGASAAAAASGAEMPRPSQRSVPHRAAPPRGSAGGAVADTPGAGDVDHGRLGGPSGAGRPRPPRIRVGVSAWSFTRRPCLGARCPGWPSAGHGSGPGGAPRVRPLDRGQVVAGQLQRQRPGLGERWIPVLRAPTSGTMSGPRDSTQPMASWATVAPLSAPRAAPRPGPVVVEVGASVSGHELRNRRRPGALGGPVAAEQACDSTP